jgi:hypothetical protein
MKKFLDKKAVLTAVVTTLTSTTALANVASTDPVTSFANNLQRPAQEICKTAPFTLHKIHRVDNKFESIHAYHSSHSSHGSHGSHQSHSSHYSSRY